MATDRGEGSVTCTECTLSTAGAGSPLIYSTGDITISKTTGTATGAQAVVIEGKNTATIKESSNLKCNVKESSNLKCNGNPNRKDVDKCGIMLYQSMSGDAASGTSTFNCDKSTIEIQSSSSIQTSSSVYSSAPMFFITNTQAKINLEECTFKYGSGVFLYAAGTSEWGNSGSNGGVVTLTLSNQDIEGDIVVDAYSGLTINLIGSTITGKINAANNAANTAAKIAISLDQDSSIILTGNSYYTSLVNEKTDGSNLVNGTYKWIASIEKEIKTTTGNNNNNQSPGGAAPNGQPPSNMPNGNGQPPNGSSDQPNGMPPEMPNGNGQPPSGSDFPNGQSPNGQPPSGSDFPNGQPSNGSNGMPNGQPPSGSDFPNGQPHNHQVVVIFLMDNLQMVLLMKEIMVILMEILLMVMAFLMMETKKFLRI